MTSTGAHPLSHTNWGTAFVLPPMKRWALLVNITRTQPQRWPRRPAAAATGLWAAAALLLELMLMHVFPYQSCSFQSVALHGVAVGVLKYLLQLARREQLREPAIPWALGLSKGGSGHGRGDRCFISSFCKHVFGMFVYKGRPWR